MRLYLVKPWLHQASVLTLLNRSKIIWIFTLVLPLTLMLGVNNVIEASMLASTAKLTLMLGVKAHSHRAIKLRSPSRWQAVLMIFKGAARKCYGDRSIITRCEWAFNRPLVQNYWILLTVVDAVECDFSCNSLSLKPRNSFRAFW